MSDYYCTPEKMMKQRILGECDDYETCQGFEWAELHGYDLNKLGRRNKFIQDPIYGQWLSDSTCLTCIYKLKENRR